MTNNILAITAVKFLFGIILISRVGYQLRKRKNMLKRHQHIPSSTHYPSLTFDAALGGFLILTTLIIVN